MDNFKKPTTEKERAELARKYTPLVYKIALQNKDKTPLDYDDVIGFGFEGLADALNTYDPNKGQTFLQYAGYRIYYFIKNGTYEEGHVVKFSAYNQEQAKKKGLPTFISKSIVSNTDENGDVKWNIPEPSCEQNHTDLEKVLYDLQSFVSRKFSTRDAEVFFQTFGLAGRDEIIRTKIAKQYNITSASITYINQRIIKAINKDDVMREKLEALL